MISVSSISATQLRHAADLIERIAILEDKLESTLHTSSAAKRKLGQPRKETSLPKAKKAGKNSL